MGDVVNLKRVRKRTAQDQVSKQAEINRVKFGRTKAKRDQEQRQSQTANNLLDQHFLARDDS